VSEFHFDMRKLVEELFNFSSFDRRLAELQREAENLQGDFIDMRKGKNGVWKAVVTYHENPSGSRITFHSSDGVDRSGPEQHGVRGMEPSYITFDDAESYAESRGVAKGSQKTRSRTTRSVARKDT